MNKPEDMTKQLCPDGEGALGSGEESVTHRMPEWTYRTFSERKMKM